MAGCTGEDGTSSALAETAIHYWGDIDTHGFGVLDRLRGAFPHARSLLMDREALLAHRAVWVTEESGETRVLDCLTDAERALYEELRKASDVRAKYKVSRRDTL